MFSGIYQATIFTYLYWTPCRKQVSSKLSWGKRAAANQKTDGYNLVSGFFRCYTGYKLYYTAAVPLSSAATVALVVTLRHAATMRGAAPRSGMGHSSVVCRDVSVPFTLAVVRYWCCDFGPCDLLRLLGRFATAPCFASYTSSTAPP